MTEHEYKQAVRRIEECNPAEVLLPALRRGHTRANEMYLRAAMKRVGSSSGSGSSSAQLSESSSRVLGTESSTKREEAWANADDTLPGLWCERTRLFGEMNKQANKFHACKTDAERAQNSTLVLGWWDDIQAVKSKIAYYQQHGEMPPAAQDDGEELPENPALLAKKLNSLRARISQKKKQLTDLAGLDPGTPGLQSKINTAEADLKRLKFLEGMAGEKLKGYEQEA